METFLRRILHRFLPKVGNQVPRYSGWKQMAQTSQSDFRAPLETKYRDIADGNFCSTPKSFTMWAVGNQVPRYSGWKREPARLPMLVVQVGNQVPRYSGWKLQAWEPQPAP